MAHAPPLLLCFANFRSCSTLFFIFMSMIISPSTLADVMLFVVLPLCTLGVRVVCITFFFSSLPSAVNMAGGGGSFICTPPSEMCFLCLLCLSLSGRYCIEIIYKSDHEAKLGYQTGDRKMKCLRRGCKQINFNRGWIPKNNNASSTRCICIRKILSLSEPKSMHTSNSIEEQFGFK